MPSAATMKSFLANNDTTMREIAEVSLNLARGLPGAETLDVPRCLQQLNVWARLVAGETKRCLPMFHRSPSEFDNFLPKFHMMALVTVLQRDLGVRYDPACQEGPYCALDPRTLFIYGLLDGHGGTCVTMPILYIAIGRRLGYPLYLVQAREHFFVRREEPAGERFNIEATTLGFTPRDDEHFCHWPKPIRDDEVRQGLFLRNLSPREEYGRLSSRAWTVLVRPPADRTGPGGVCGSGAAGSADTGRAVFLAIAFLLDRVVKYFGRDVLLATPATEIQLPPSAAMGAAGPTACPGAVEEDRRQLSCEGNPFRFHK